MSAFKLVEPGQGRLWWWPGGVVRWLAVGEDTGERYVLQEETVAPGAGPMAYIQQRASEGTYVLDGGPLKLRAGDRTQRLGPGSFVRLARGTAHELKNAGEGEARLLRWCFPAGFDRFLFAAGKAIDEPDDPPEATEAKRKRVRDLAPEFGIEMEPDEEAFTKPATSPSCGAARGRPRRSPATFGPRSPRPTALPCTTWPWPRARARHRCSTRAPTSAATSWAAPCASTSTTDRSRPRRARSCTCRPAPGCVFWRPASSRRGCSCGRPRRLISWLWPGAP